MKFNYKVFFQLQFLSLKLGLHSLTTVVNLMMKNEKCFLRSDPNLIDLKSDQIVDRYTLLIDQ